MVIQRAAQKKSAAKKAVKKKTTKKASRKQQPETSAAQKGSATGLAAQGGVVRQGLLNIDYSLCEGCGGCAEAFPRLFEMRAELAWVIGGATYDPVRDAGVRTICPYYAITIE